MAEATATAAPPLAPEETVAGAATTLTEQTAATTLTEQIAMGEEEEAAEAEAEGFKKMTVAELMAYKPDHDSKAAEMAAKTAGGKHNIDKMAGAILIFCPFIFLLIMFRLMEYWNGK